jgi:hypothetical protein
MEKKFFGDRVSYGEAGTVRALAKLKCGLVKSISTQDLRENEKASEEFIDEDLPHLLGCDGEEMRAALPMWRTKPNHADIRFVHQGALCSVRSGRSWRS